MPLFSPVSTEEANVSQTSPSWSCGSCQCQTLSGIFQGSLKVLRDCSVSPKATGFHHVPFQACMVWEGYLQNFWPWKWNCPDLQKCKCKLHLVDWNPVAFTAAISLKDLTFLGAFSQSYQQTCETELMHEDRPRFSDLDWVWQDSTALMQLSCAL